MRNIWQSIKKIDFKKAAKVIWYGSLACLAVYVFLVLKAERAREWQNIHQYVHRDGKYVLVKERLEDFKANPDILSIEFSELVATHGEMLVEGSLSVSFYDPDRYFKGGSEKEEAGHRVEILIDCRTERYRYHPLMVNIDCDRVLVASEPVCSGFTEAIFIPKEGHLFDYPLDHLTFSIILSVRPEIKFDQIDIYNRAPGILIEVPDSIEAADSKIPLAVETARKRSIQMAYLIITAALILYIILILACVKKLGTLISAVGGFFISVWSIRSLFIEDALVFPTLLDITVIFASVILLVGILSKIIFGKLVDAERS